MSNNFPTHKLRSLVLICGDQLDSDSAALDDFDPAQDAVLMTEAVEEATYIRQHKRRIAFFFSAMRHFAQELRALGYPVIYNKINDADAPFSLAEGLAREIKAHGPSEIRLVCPGDHRVLMALERCAKVHGASLSLVEDRHFFSTPEAFSEFFEGRKRTVLEDYYRALRKRTGYLMEEGGPVGGAWNFDKDNRKSFGKKGPGLLPRRESFAPDEITQEVLQIVERRFADHPGSLADFDEPVTRDDAQKALSDFIKNRLPDFGQWQDAMWGGESTLYHSRISAVMNVKLLSPREACDAAIRAYEKGYAPLNAVEGFVRQILGWREFTRGIYWHLMPDYAERNALEAERDVPDFFWTGHTEMACLNDMLGRLLKTGYAHHIERLMGMGLYMLLRGTNPYAAHEWHMALYLDAVDWVSLPNVLGMSQHGDGGVVGTKPYCASGAYINRMSNYCSGCRFDPAEASGPEACPFTAFYWDFLARHEGSFSTNRRMALQLKNLRNKSEEETKLIRSTASQFLSP